MGLCGLTQISMALDIRDTKLSLLNVFFHPLELSISTKMKKCEMALFSSHVMMMLCTTLARTMQSSIGYSIISKTH